MDIKAPVEKYPLVTNSKINPEKITQSIDLIMNCGIDYEFRTTVVKSQLAYEDFENIGKLIYGAKRYYLQKFIPSKTLDDKMMCEKTYTDEEFKEIIEILKPCIKEVSVR